MLNKIKSSVEASAPKVQIFLTVDTVTRDFLYALKSNLLADSIGEVIRRAILAYEIYDPHHEVAEGTADPTIASKFERYLQRVHTIHARVPAEVKDKVVKMALDEGRGQSEILVRAIEVLHQITTLRERGAAIESKAQDGALVQDRMAACPRPAGISEDPRPGRNIGRVLDKESKVTKPICADMYVI